jgi:hypothetical protein
LDELHSSLNGSIDTALDIHRVRACRDCLETLLKDGLRQHGCGGRAVARDIVRLGRHLAHELRAHILEAVF